MQTAPRFDQRGPQAGFEFPEEEYLDLPTSGSMAQEPGREYFGIIDDDAVARSEVFRKIAEVTVVEGSRMAVDNEHARG